MKYRLVVQTTDDQGAVSEDELLPEVISEPGWQCAHAIWLVPFPTGRLRVRNVSVV